MRLKQEKKLRFRRLVDRIWNLEVARSLRVAKRGGRGIWNKENFKISWRAILDFKKLFFRRAVFVFLPPVVEQSSLRGTAQKYILRRVFIFFLIFAWLFNGWPQLQEAQAANTTTRPNNDGTTGTFTSTAATYYTEIDDDPDSPTDADYVTGPNKANGQMFVLLIDMPVGFGDATSVEIRARHRENGSGDDKIDIYYQIYESDETTAITSEVGSTAIGATFTTTGYNPTITGTNTKASWDGARIRIRQVYSQVKGPDTTSQAEISAVEVNITYTDITVGATGSQTANMVIPSTNNYVGGAFTITENASSRNVTGITIAEQGTVNAQADLDNIKLYYENDTSAPYDCVSETYGGTESQFGSTDTDGFSGVNGTSAFTGSVEISTTATMCVYVVLDVGSGASNEETLEIQITNPSTDVTTSAGTVGPASAVTIAGTTNLMPPGVIGTLGKNTDGWSGAVPVYMELVGLDHGSYPYARAKVDTPAPVTWYATMTWDSEDERFEGTIYIGSNYCNGCADPNTGTYTVTVQLDNNSDFSSIDYSDGAGTFTTFITRRWNAVSDSAMGNSTEFNPTWNVDHWDYSIEDFSVNAAATNSNVAIAIPFHPTTANISNMAVQFDDIAVSQGSAESTTDVWWWDNDTHTLYVQNNSQGTTYTKVDLDFDSDTDLFATRIDRVKTYNMGERLFYNGLSWGNNYIGTAMFGGGHEGAGEQMELHARDFSNNNDVSVDCMERVAVHVDNTIAADDSAYYSANIKWKQQEWVGYIVSENNNQIVTRVNSDDTASTGWQQQLNNGIAAYREQTFYANERYIKNVYQLTNNGASTRIYPLVWGREQWIGTDRATNDQGRYDGDTADRTIESTVAISGLTDPWMTSYDTGVFAAMGLIFQDADPARYGYFLAQPAITNSSPWAEWVNQGSEYRPDDNDSDTTASNIFFDKNYPSVGVGNSVTFTFWQWGYDTTSWTNIESAIDADSQEVNPASTLTTDIVDDAGSSVASPSIAMGAVTFSFSYQTANGTFGVSTEKIRVENTTANSQWNLTIAADSGSTAFWNGATSDYDFNDPTANAGDGGDADSLGGQMTIDASGGTLGGTCSATGITKESSASFSEGVTDSITLLTAGASADTSCYWDFTGVSVSQTIPAEQPAASDYSINMTLTVTAI